MKLLTPGRSSPKISHGDLEKYEAAVLHLAPHTLAGKQTVCPDSTKQCRATCLYWAGRGGMDYAQQARLERTKLWNREPGLFWSQLYKELELLAGRAKRSGKQAVVRLDGTSDLGLGDGVVARDFPKILFYDYTKSVARYTEWLRGSGRVFVRQNCNRYLTFSRSETNWMYCKWFLDHPTNPGNVTVVFHPTIPKMYGGFKVINGDSHDFRFLDPPGVIVGLTAKGIRAKRLAEKDPTGFVVRTA